MTQDEIISMAREAGLPTLTEYGYESLQRFAALVAAHEREKQTDISALPIIIEVAVKEAVLAEREACAKLFADEDCLFEGKHIAAAIRARSEK